MHKEINMSRRSAMLAIPAMGATVLAFPLAAEAAPSEKVIGLIAAHRAATAAFENLCDIHDAASSSYKVPFTLVPTFIRADGKALRYWEFSAYPDATEGEIHKVHDAMRERHCGKAASAVHSAAAIAEASHAITVSLRRCLKAHRSAVADEARYREECGYAQIERDYDAASERERNALADLCAARCTTAIEAKAKREYLAQFVRRNQLDEDHIHALIGSLTAA